MNPDIHISLADKALHITVPEGAQVLALTIAGVSCTWSVQDAPGSRRILSAALASPPQEGEPLPVAVSWSFHGARFETHAVLNGASSLVEEWQETIGPFSI